MFRTSHARHVSAAGFLLAFSGLATTIVPLPVLAADQNEGPSEKLYYDLRDEIPTEFRWDLQAIYPDVEAWEAKLEAVEAAVPGIGAYKGRLGESPEVLAEAFGKAFELSRDLEDIFVYSHQGLHTNMADADANALSGRARALAGKVSEVAAFIDPEIGQISEETMAEFLKNEELAPYAHHIDNIVRTKEHLLSAEIEQILAGSSLSGAAHQQAFSSLENADIEWPTVLDEKGAEIKVVPGQYIRFVTSDDRRLRREASLALFETYSQFANTFAATLGGSIQRDLWMARTRGYGSTLEMSLDSTNVPRSVVDRLVETVHDNIDKIRNYAKLRKKLQGLDELHIYDMYMNLLPGIDKKYTFDEGWALAMQFWRETFGEEYASVAERARKERWIDVYTNEGKRPGAYSWGSYNSHPYLFLNWGGSLEAVSTLVHEMGHSIHSYLANQNNPYHDADYSLFVAEVGSVASESLFLDWMLNRSTDPDERKLLLNKAMNDITGTFVRQIFFHEWEAMAHQMAQDGEPLTKESLGKPYGDLWREYYGPDLVVDDVYDAGWSRISHYYRTFYVWVYATSYAAGEAIAARFRSGDEGAVDDYLAALKLGGSVYPMEALARAGVDMNDPSVIRSVMDRYGEIQERLEAELMTTGGN
jgi:oligoendopeptidase F